MPLNWWNFGSKMAAKMTLNGPFLGHVTFRKLKYGIELHGLLLNRCHFGSKIAPLLQNVCSKFRFVYILWIILMFAFQAIRQSIEQQLPQEPSEGSSQPISRIRIRTPTGEAIIRRFLATDLLQTLFDFIASKGYPTEDFKVLSSWPRRDVGIRFLSAFSWTSLL